MQLPGMPQGVGSSDIESYLQKQRSGMNRFGADERMALQDSIDARQDSLGFKAQSGLKGLSDAIMMGVAGAGNPGWQNQFEAGEAQRAQGKIGAFKDARSANLENIQGGMTLDQMDPNSELSKSKQESYAPLFAKLGYQPSALKGMSASNIDSSLALMAQFGGKQIDAMIKQFELDIERSKMAAMAGKESSANELARQKMKNDAASELLKRSGNARVWGIPVPFTSDVSGAEEDAARKTLMGTINGEGAGEVSGRDQEALDWAKANPGDPRAEQIKKRLGQ